MNRAESYAFVYTKRNEPVSKLYWGLICNTPYTRQLSFLKKTVWYGKKKKQLFTGARDISRVSYLFIHNYVVIHISLPILKYRYIYHTQWYQIVSGGKELFSKTIQNKQQNNQTVF